MENNLTIEFSKSNENIFVSVLQSKSFWALIVLGEWFIFMFIQLDQIIMLHGDLDIIWTFYKKSWSGINFWSIIQNGKFFLNFLSTLSPSLCVNTENAFTWKY